MVLGSTFTVKPDQRTEIVERVFNIVLVDGNFRNLERWDLAFNLIDSRPFFLEV